MAMVITVLEAVVAPERVADLKVSYADAGKSPLPDGLVRSALLQDTRDPTRWRIETVWESPEALSRMRQAGKPKGLQIFESAGARPSLDIFRVVGQIDPAGR